MTAFTYLCRYINQQFTIPTSSIESNHRLQTDLGLNDIELTEVVVFMELLYGLTLPDDVLTPTLSVDQLCTLVEQHVTQNNSVICGTFSKAYFFYDSFLLVTKVHVRTFHFSLTTFDRITTQW